MIDTIRITQKEAKPESDKWADAVITTSTAISVTCKAVTLGKENKPRITYYPSDEIVSFEVSLPKFLKGQNVDVLTDAEVVQATSQAIAWVEEKLQVKIGDPRPSRIDYCTAWDMGKDTDAYLKAFSGFPVSGYTRSPYVQDDGITQGFTWRNKARKINFYDKGLEAGLPGVSILRYETQNLNGKSLDLVSGRVGLPRDLGLISNQVARQELRGWLSRAGLTGEFQTEDDLFLKLMSSYTVEKAFDHYGFTTLYKKYGISLKNFMTKNKYFYKRNEMLSSGWLCQAERKLPALEIQ